MIKYAVSEKNGRTGLLGLGLLVVAVWVGWLVVQNRSAISPPEAIDVSAQAPGTAFTAIDPADRKFFEAGHMALLMGERRIDALAHVNPADRKFYTNEYIRGGGSNIDPLANVHAADRKFYTNGYVPGSP